MPNKHKVKAGECISSIAEQYGFFPDTIWSDPANAELRSLRKEPNILCPGDVVVIPDKRPKQVSGATDTEHRFRKLGVPALFRFQVFDADEPRANQQFVLDVDGHLYKGTTDGQGQLEIGIDPRAKQGRLIIGPDNYEIEISFGHLSPITETDGVADRLENLGYTCRDGGKVDKALLAAALRSFQERFELPVTGEADDATRQKLVDIHDKTSRLPEEE